MVMEKPVYVNGKKYVFINRLPSKERLAFINYASFDYLVSVGQPEIANEPCASYSDYNTNLVFKRRIEFCYVFGVSCN